VPSCTVSIPPCVTRPLQMSVFLYTLVVRLTSGMQSFVEGCKQLGQKAYRYLKNINTFTRRALIGADVIYFVHIGAKLKHCEQHTSPFTSFIALPDATRSLWTRQPSYSSFESTILRIKNTECHLRIFIGWSDVCCCFCQVNYARIDAMPTSKTCNSALIFLLCIIGLSFTYAFGATGSSLINLRRSPHASLSMKLFDWKKRAAFDQIVMPPSTLRLFVARSRIVVTLYVRFGRF